MKTRSAGLIVLACVVALICAGCATGGGQSTAQSTTGTKKANNKYCTWEFDYSLDGSGKVQKDTFKLTSGQDKCTVESSTGDLYIGEKGKEKKIKDSSAAVFETEGSCRRCYINSSGGITCVTYPC